MSPSRHRAHRLILLAAVSLPGSGTAAEREKDSGEPHWIFHLFPKAAQKNPTLELTVITEMTEAGKKLPPVSAQSPAFFQAHSLGYKQLGDVSAGEKTLKPGEIERVLLRSLATSGYQPARLPAQPPSLVIFYYWGAHSVLNEGDPENPALSVEQMRRNLLDRAALVGGAKFAKELLALLQETDAFATAANVQLAPGGAPPIPPGALAFANPVNLFKLRSTKNELLLNQIAGDVYYVVASAYDYQSVVANQKVLLWRTRMTVSARGVSQEQSLPALLLSAGPFFGREMKEPEIISKRAVREGNVEMGTPTVVGPSPAPPPSVPAK
jgi:hypothetical protein